MMSPIKNEYLIHPVSLTALVLIVLVSLTVLFPKESLYADPRLAESPDILSVAYNKVLLSSRPDNAVVRLSLAIQQRKLGRLDEALVTLSPILDLNAAHLEPSLQAAVLHEEITLMSARLALLLRAEAAETDLSDDESVAQQLKRELRARIFSALEKGWPVSLADQASAFAVTWLGLEDQILFATRRLSMLGYGSDTTADQLALAKLLRADGNPLREAAVLARAFENAAPDDASLLLIRTRWLEAALESSPADALAAATVLIQQFPEDRALLEQGIGIAVQNSNLPMTIQWSEQARQLDSRNPQRLEDLLSLSLAMGEFHSALAYADLLLEIAPPSAALREQAADLYSWAGDSQKALAHWETLALETGSEKAVAATWQIALNEAEPARAITVLRKASQRRVLTAREWLAMIDAYEQISLPDEALAITRKVVAAYPGHHELWQKRYRLEFNRGDYAAAAATFSAMRETIGLNQEEVLLMANSYWRLGQTYQAYSVLKNYTGSDNSQPVEYWMMRAELANRLNLIDDRDFCLDRFSVNASGVNGLASLGEPGYLKRLISLQDAKGAHLAATELAKEGYARFHDAGFLLLALQQASAGRDMAAVEHLLMTIQLQGVPVEHFADVWAIRALLAVSQADQQDALYAWEQAMAKAPAEKAYRTAYYWFLIDHSDAMSEKLAGELRQLEKKRKPTVSDTEILAMGWTGLQEPERALPWLEKGLPDHLQDWRWLSATSRTQRLTGNDSAAIATEKATLRLLAADLSRHAQGNSRQTDLTSADAEYSQKLEQFLRLYHDYGNPLGARNMNLAILDKSVVLPQDHFLSTMGEKPALDELLYDARQSTQSDLQRRLLVMGMEWALVSGDDYIVAEYEKLASVNGFSLPAWQQLAIGLKKRDDYLIEQVLEQFHQEIPKADQMLAYRQVGQKQKARDIAREVASQVADRQQGSSSRDTDVSRDILKDLGSAWQAAADYSEFGYLTIARAALKGVFLWDDTPVSLRLVSGSFGSSDDNLFALNSDLEKQLEAGVGFEHSLKQTSLISDVALRMFDDRLLPGFSLIIQPQTAGSITQEGRLFLGRSTELTSALTAIGQESGLGYSAGYQIDPQNRLMADAAWRTLTDPDYQALGSGYGFNLMATHQPMTDPADMTIRLVHQHSRYTAESDIRQTMLPYFEVLTEEEALFPDTFDRSSAGIRLARGSLHRVLPEWAGRWHGLADVEAGYEWQDRNWDAGLQLGAGITLDGHDELALSLGWSEAAQSGEARKAARLTYSRSLEKD